MPDGTLHFNVGIDALPDFGAGMELVEDALPENVPVAVSGTKWAVVDKALTLKYQKIKEDCVVRYELPIPDGNVSGLKLKHTAKTGVFNGSFKMYATKGGEKPKLKKYTVNVVGFVVDGVGYGQATMKKPAAGPWFVTVE